MIGIQDLLKQNPKAIFQAAVSEKEQRLVLCESAVSLAQSLGKGLYIRRAKYNLVLGNRLPWRGNRAQRDAEMGPSYYRMRQLYSYSLTLCGGFARIGASIFIL